MERVKKYTVTAVFGIIGMVTWILTILLREMSVMLPGAGIFVLGVMPNISALWVLLWFGEVFVCRKNRIFTIQKAGILSGVILMFAILSEVVHDKFLRSPFDRYDILATVLAILVYLLVRKRHD